MKRRLRGGSVETRSQRNSVPDIWPIREPPRARRRRNQAQVAAPVPVPVPAVVVPSSNIPRPQPIAMHIPSPEMIAPPPVRPRIRPSALVAVPPPSSVSGSVSDVGLQAPIGYMPAPARFKMSTIFQGQHTLDKNQIPANIRNTNNNFYIYPVDVIQYFDSLDRNSRIFVQDNTGSGTIFVDLQKLHSQMGKMMNDANGIRSRPGVLGTREEKLLWSFKNMRNISQNAQNDANRIFPYMKKDSMPFRSQNVFEPAKESLVIPGKDVLDLPNYVMLYLLFMLAQEGNDPSKSRFISFSIGPASRNAALSDLIQPVYQNSGRVVNFSNRYIRWDDLQNLYMRIMKQVAHVYGVETNNTQNPNSLVWHGDDDSGDTRIMLLQHPGSFDLALKLFFSNAPLVGVSQHWTQEIEDLIKATVGDSVLSVRNKTDNKCFIYCIIIAIILKMRDNKNRLFSTKDVMIEPSEVYCKAMFYFNKENDPYVELLRKLAKLIVPPTYSNGPLDPLCKMVADIDQDVGKLLTMGEYNHFFDEFESNLITDNSIGIDVYGIDFNVNKHVYPLYISRIREKTIELLCITPKNSTTSHCCVITNMEKLMRNSGGKQFWSCSKCGQCFYHRRLLAEHYCNLNPRSSLVSGDGGYHFASKYSKEACDMIEGVCPKCRLCFTDSFTYEYHKTHCFMNGKTGYRHVQLVTYKDNEHPLLEGEAIDLEVENRHVSRRRVMYADFESSINPETGDHTFMSYGIYDWKTRIYKCGYTLEEFFNFILEMAYNHDEDQIYVYFHNAMGYDANFILRYVLSHESCNDWGIKVIMKSSNRLQKLSFYTHVGDKSRTIHIGDTFMFLTLSLEKIVGSIRKDDVSENQHNFSRFFDHFHFRYPGVTDEEIDHILRKNIFPYKFFTDSDKLAVNIDDFLKIFEAKSENLQYFSEHVTVDVLKDNYDDVKHVVEVFKCLTARDYHDLYLCCDVMELADVFNRSMEILWDSHKIHLTRYIGMPSASWAAFLRFDPSMKIPLYEETFFAEFFKGMIRGGITSAALRHAVADEKHSIIYLDVNGLYPYVMQKYKFPCGQFTFMPFGWTGEQCAVRLDEYFRMFEREGKGMCFCVDMVITDEVKKLTDMYPFAPEHRRIYKEYYQDFDKKELTPFLRKWSENNAGEKMKEFTGLVCTLYDKQKYNVHWRLLKFYMEHGVKITKVWHGVLFDEGDYLAGYIRKNIAIRNTRKDELGKTLYKLLGNSIYGKTFESPFKRNTYEIIKDPIKLQGLLAEGNIASVTPIDELGWIVRMDGEDIILNKPTYIGACVCEFAKLHMYTLLYDKLFSIFPGTSTEPGCQMVYTDTDSFIVKVRHPDDVEIKSPKDLFDYIKTKDDTLIGGIGGQVKSETGEDDTIQEIIALRSKVYAYITKDGHIGKRAKGTTHDAQELQLDWDTYKQALESLKSIDTRNVQFVRNTFKIATLDVYRQSLSVNDGKRYICEDGIHTHAFGFPISEQNASVSDMDVSP